MYFFVAGTEKLWLVEESYNGKVNRKGKVTVDQIETSSYHAAWIIQPEYDTRPTVLDEIEF